MLYRQKHTIMSCIFFLYFFYIKMIISQFDHTFVKQSNQKWAMTWQNQQSDYAPSEDSDQPGHPPSLIRVFTVRMKKAGVLSYPLSAQRRLWSDWADAQADLSLCWAHTHFVGFVMSRLKWLFEEGACIMQVIFYTHIGCLQVEEKSVFSANICLIQVIFVSDTLELRRYGSKWIFKSCPD